MTLQRQALMGASQMASPSTLWTPAMSAVSVAVWNKASDPDTFSLDNSAAPGIIQWRNKSGNVWHYEQPASANRPTLDQSAINGLPAVRIVNGPGTGATRQWLQNALTYSGSQVTVFSVHRNSSSSVSGSAQRYGRLFSFSDNNSQDYNNNNGLILTYGVSSGISLYRNNSIIASTAAINDAWCLVDAVRNGTSGSVCLNGGTRANGTTASAPQGIQRSRLGNDIAAGDSGMLGWIHEQVIIFGVLDSLTTAKMQGYLLWDSGLESLLPAGHLFKSSRPTA